MNERVLIADDHELLCQGLKTVLEEAHFEVVGEAFDGEQTLALADKYLPDVVIMDVRMPKIDGVVACQRITTSLPKTKVLMLSAYDDEEEILASFEAGASGYVLKDLPPDDLIKAVQLVAKDQAILHPAITKKVLQRLTSFSKVSKEVKKPSPLTSREKEVLKLVAQGFQNKEIAKKLFISEKTVKTHLSHILNKLEQPTRSQAVFYALSQGLLSIPEENFPS